MKKILREFITPRRTTFLKNLDFDYCFKFVFSFIFFLFETRNSAKFQLGEEQIFGRIVSRNDEKEGLGYNE